MILLLSIIFLFSACSETATNSKVYLRVDNGWTSVNVKKYSVGSNGMIEIESDDGTVYLTTVFTLIKREKSG